VFSSKRRQRRLAEEQQSNTPEVPDGGDTRSFVRGTVTPLNGRERGRVRTNPAIRDWTLEPTGRAP
jgi:hypothetical protein